MKFPQNKTKPFFDKRKMAYENVVRYLNQHQIQVNVGGSFKLNEAVTLSLKDMAARIWYEYSGNLPKDHYLEALKLVRQLALEHLYKNIKNDFILAPKAANDAALREALRVIVTPTANEEQFEYYVQAVSQLIWQIKRKFLNKPTVWDIFVVFYSRNGGTGKSTWIQSFGRCLGDYFMEDADFDLFLDKWRKATLSKFYLAFIDEMQSADAKELRAIKNTITKSKVQGRGMHSEDEFDRPRNASFIAASNKRLTEDINDESMRRWVEIECNETRMVDDAERAQRLREINWAAVWACVDADDESPYAGNVPIFTKHQQKLESETPFDLITDDLFEVHEGSLLRNLDAFEAFKNVKGYTPSIQKFATNMKRKYELARTRNPVIYKNLRIRPKSGEE